MEIRNWSILLFVACLSWACENKEEIFQGSLTFSAQNLMPLEDGLQYHLWRVQDTTFTLVSTLDPDEFGNVTIEDNTIDEVQLMTSTALAVSIEASTPDANNIGPIIIAGDWSGSDDSLGLGHSLALGNSFRVASGQYQLVSPSSQDANDTLSGIWYYDTSYVDTLTLFIPELTDQWIYQSWLEVDEIYLNMGQFKLATEPDDSDIYSGPIETIRYPGEDFVDNAPAGLTFPLDVRGHKLILAIHPIVDGYREQPFFLIPLSDLISDAALLPPQFNFMFREDMIFPTGKGRR